MKKRFLIQTQGKKHTGLPVNFLKEGNTPDSWYNHQEAYETFNAAAIDCEKLIKTGHYKADEVQILEVVGTFLSDISVTVNKTKETEVVLVPGDIAKRLLRESAPNKL